jgi:hypothetical protein
VNKEFSNIRGTPSPSNKNSKKRTFTRAFDPTKNSQKNAHFGATTSDENSQCTPIQRTV